jgi:hypothetical protein
VVVQVTLPSVDGEVFHVKDAASVSIVFQEAGILLIVNEPAFRR